MKNTTYLITLIITLAHLLIITLVQAQPSAFKYQAVVRDDAGDPIANQTIGVQICLLTDSATGDTIYTETHSVTSSNLGLLNVEVGNGTATLGDFSTIDWSAANHFIQLKVDTSGGSNYFLLGTAQLLSVPYALYAGGGPKDTVICDNDGDTKIQVEESADEDIIRFDIAGTERLVLKDNGNGQTMLEFPNSISYNSNLFIGNDAGLNMSPAGSGGLGNTFIGSDAGELNVTGNENTLIGKNAGNDNTESSNTFVGNNTGAGNTGGSSNSFFGTASGANSTGSNNVFWGLIVELTPQVATNSTLKTPMQTRPMHSFMESSTTICSG